MVGHKIMRKALHLKTSFNLLNPDSRSGTSIVLML